MGEKTPIARKVFRNKVFFSGCCFLLLSMYLLYLISRFPDTASEYRTISPTFFPYLLATILGGLSILLILEGGRKPVGSIFSIDPEKKETFQTGALLLILAVFSLLLSTLGFMLDSFLFMIGTQLLLGRRRIVRLTGMALAISLGMYFVFAVLFKIPLPQGVFMD